MENQSFIDRYLSGIAEITERIDRAAIDALIEAIFALWRADATLYIIGNGGSASTATHFAADLAKCTIAPDRPRLRVLSLVDNIPLMSALVNDEGWGKVYTEQLETHFRPGDGLLAISVHGGSGSDKAGPWSQNLVAALRYAKDHDGVALGLAGFDGGAMAQVCDVSVVVPFETTPHVESYHVVLHHLVTFCLAEKMRA